MNKLYLVAAALALLCLAGVAQANITIDTVTVGNPGNTADTAAHSGNPGGQGAVAYTYNIGKYEVTTSQYTAFLNAVAKTDTYGLYSTKMDTAVHTDGRGCNIKRTGTSGKYVYTVGSGSSTDITNWGNRPVNYVSYWDSCRFANWLGNGQKTGLQYAATTETGAYTLNGYTGIDGRAIGRNAGWKWAVTSEDEWYKAAYYKSGGSNSGYWLYPTQSNTAPANQVLATDPGNSANYLISSNYSIGSPYYRTNVGEFENSGSAYGTFDQGGNVQEWNEAIPYILDGKYALRGLRGGEFLNNPGISLESSSRPYNSAGPPGGERYGIGFRVSEVPEASPIIALSGGLVGLLGLRRRLG